MMVHITADSQKWLRIILRPHIHRLDSNIDYDVKGATEWINVYYHTREREREEER